MVCCVEHRVEQVESIQHDISKSKLREVLGIVHSSIHQQPTIKLVLIIYDKN